jgi:hypothetical protein
VAEIVNADVNQSGGFTNTSPWMLIGIKPIHRPRLHGKVLAWDDDNLAVTSQNWLSADPSDVARRSEIGIFVESNRIADYLIRRFDHARSG